MERIFISFAVVFGIATILLAVVNSIKEGRIAELRRSNDDLKQRNGELIEDNIVLEAQREVFCKGEITVTINASTVDPSTVESIANVVRHNLKKAERRRRV